MSQYHEHPRLQTSPTVEASKPAPYASPDSYGHQTMMVIDYDKPLDDPDRFTAIVITPGQLEELSADSDPDDSVQYTQWQDESIVFSRPLSSAEAKPLYLAANSRLRGSAATEELAISAALYKYVSKLGEIVIQNNPTSLRLQ